MMPIVSAEARKTGVEIQVDCPPDLPLLRADPAMLQQALQNLALNACQAMPGGGRLRIAGRAARDRFIEVAVEDTGAGIAAEHLDKIFNLYFTTREGGSGIGLSMVYRTVQLHDGEIEVHSSPGKGTALRFIIVSGKPRLARSLPNFRKRAMRSCSSAETSPTKRRQARLSPACKRRLVLLTC